MRRTKIIGAGTITILLLTMVMQWKHAEAQTLAGKIVALSSEKVYFAASHPLSAECAPLADLDLSAAYPYQINLLDKFSEINPFVCVSPIEPTTSLLDLAKCINADDTEIGFKSGVVGEMKGSPLFWIPGKNTLNPLYPGLKAFASNNDIQTDSQMEGYSIHQMLLQAVNEASIKATAQYRAVRTCAKTNSLLK